MHLKVKEISFKIQIASSLWLLALTAGSFPSLLDADQMKIVAVVNDEVITQAELDRALTPALGQLQQEFGPEELAAKSQTLRETILQQMIEERLMLQEARHPRPVEVSKGRIGTPQPIVTSDEEVEEVLAKAQARFKNPEEFSEALSQQGMTLDDLKARYQDQITIQKLIEREVRSRVAISPAEITAVYQAHAEAFFLPPAVQVATIFIRPKDSLDAARAYATAQDLRRRLSQGEDFYDLAGRYSDGPNAKTGGRIGFLEKGKSLPEIDEALFSLKAGEISPVVKTQTGFHLFRVEAIRPARQLELTEVQDRIRQQLFQEKMSAQYREWIEKLKADAYISIQ